MKNDEKDFCPLCQGNKEQGTVTFSVDFGLGVFMMRHVPATVCSQCGAEWISDEVATRLDELVDEARQRHQQVEILEGADVFV